MWQLIKEELKYNRTNICLVISILLTFMVIWIFWGRQNPANSYPALRMIYLNLMLIFLISNIARQFKEKTLRIHTLLPLSSWKIGLTRILVFPSVGLPVLIGFALSLIFFKSDFVTSVIVWDWFSLTGVLLLVNVLPFLHRDLTRWFTGRSQKIMITIFYILILACMNLAYYFFIRVLETTSETSWLQPVKQNFHDYATSPQVITFLLLLSFGLMFLNIFTFHQRKTYLE